MFAFLQPRIEKHIRKELEKTFKYANINKRLLINGYYLWKLERITKQEGCFFTLYTKYEVTMDEIYSVHLLQD